MVFWGATIGGLVGWLLAYFEIYGLILGVLTGTLGGWWLGNVVRSLAKETLKQIVDAELTTLPGVGPIVATSLVAAIDDGRHFKSGRALSAWIGLVLRQYSTGGKPRLGGIGNRANYYLRRQLVHGARSALLRIGKHDDRRSKWAQDLLSRAGHNKTLVAMANKTARMAWAILRSEESYKVA